MKLLRLALAIILAGVVWVGGAGGTAVACSCASITDAEAMEMATDVFVGRVDVLDDSDEVDSARIEVRYVMAVDAVYKGDAFSTQVISTGQRGGGCGAEMAIGGSYLVHARRSGDRLTTSLCDANRATSAAMLVDTLGQGSAPNAGVDPEVERVESAANTNDTAGESDRSPWISGGALLIAMAAIAGGGIVLGRRARRDDPGRDMIG